MYNNSIRTVVFPLLLAAGVVAGAALGQSRFRIAGQGNTATWYGLNNRIAPFKRRKRKITNLFGIMLKSGLCFF